MTMSPFVALCVLKRVQFICRREKRGEIVSLEKWDRNGNVPGMGNDHDDDDDEEEEVFFFFPAVPH